MRLVYVFTMLCLIAPSGYGTAVEYQANPDNLQYVGHNDTRYSHPPSAGTSFSVNYEPSRTKSDQDSSDDRQESHDWSAPIVVVTGAYVIVTVLMLIAINKQTKLAERQIELTEVQGKWMAEQADYMRRQWCSMREQASTTQGQLVEMGKQTTLMDGQLNALWKQIGMVVAKDMARLLVNPRPIELHTVPPPHKAEISVTHYGPTEAYNVYAMAFSWSVIPNNFQPEKRRAT